MFKLLTETEKAKVVKEYKRRRTIMVLVLGAFVLIVAIIGLMPSYLLSESRLNNAREVARLAEESGEGNEDQEYLSWLQATTRKLDLLDPKLDIDKPTLAMETFLAQDSTDIKILGISWKWVEGGADMAVEGVAESRQALIKFEETLSEVEEFSGVFLPVSNLARERDIEFQITFTYTHAEE